MTGRVTFAVLVVLMTLLAGMVYAGGGEEKIELVPVYEKTFDEPIVDVIFDTATVSIEEAKKMGWKEEAFSIEERNFGKVLVSYPKVVMVSGREDLSHWSWESQRKSDYVKEIRFYGKGGNLLKTVEVGRVRREQIHVSPLGRYILIRAIPSEFDTQRTGSSLYDWDGKRIWEKSGPHPIAVSDEGYTVAAYLDWQAPPEPGGSFYIYDPLGKLIKTIHNPETDRISPLFAKYVESSNYSVLVFTADFAPPAQIYLIKGKGEILWKRSFPQYEFSTRYEEMVILKNKGIVGIFDLKKRSSSGKIEEWIPYVFYLDWQGNLKWKVPLEIRGNMIIKVSEDEKRVYIVSTEGYLWCVEIITGKTLWKHKEPWSPDKPVGWEVPLFCELEIINNTLYIIGKQGRDWHSSALFVFDGGSGDLLKKVEYPHDKIFFATAEKTIGLINTSKCKVLLFKKEVSR